MYDFAEIASGIFAGIFIEVWFSIIKNEPSINVALHDWNKSIFLILGIAFIIVTVWIDMRESKKVSDEKETIIINSLSAYSGMYFYNVNPEDYQICSMILVDHNGEIRTPYYINEGINPAIRDHRPTNFSDIGELFAKKKNKVCKPISYADWQKENEDYQSKVPDSLRCIIAVPIYSTKEPDSSEILGVLEFDMFAQKKEITDMDKNLFKSLTEWNKIESLREYSHSIAYMLEL